MKQFDVPIIHKTYQLYLEVYSLKKTIPKIDRHSHWLRVENYYYRYSRIPTTSCLFEPRESSKLTKKDKC